MTLRSVMCEPGIYQVYSRYILVVKSISGIYLVYTWYILMHIFSGFHDDHPAQLSGPPVPPETTPDPHDEMDFDVPDTRFLLDEFMAKLSKSVDDEYRTATLSAIFETLRVLAGYPKASAIAVPDDRDKRLISKANTAILQLSLHQK